MNKTRFFWEGRKRKREREWGRGRRQETAIQEAQIRPLGWKDPLEKGMVTHSSILAWEIPWTEEPSRLQFMGSQRVQHDWLTKPSHSGLRRVSSELPVRPTESVIKLLSFCFKLCTLLNACCVMPGLASSPDFQLYSAQREGSLDRNGSLEKEKRLSPPHLLPVSFHSSISLLHQ